MRLNVRNKLDNSLIETFIQTNGQSLSDIISEHFSDYQAGIRYPVTLCVNDDIVIQKRWQNYYPSADDTLTLYHEAQGAFAPILIKAAVSFAVYAGTMYLSKPKIDNYNPTVQGASIHQAAGRANTPRLGSPPAQVFGRHKYWPDLISAPWVAYENNIQYRYMLLSTGVGEYDYETISIGNTPINRLSGFDISIFPPGTDVTAHPAHQHIYTSDEVGNTTSTQGLKLESGGYVSASNAMPDGLEYDFTGNTITATEQVDDGAGGFTPTPYQWPYLIGDFVQINSDFNSGVYKVTAVNQSLITLSDDADDSVSFTDTTAIAATIDQVTATPEGEWVGPYLSCPEGSTTDTLYLDILYQGGIGKEESNGSISAISITTEIQYRASENDPWITETITKTDATRDDVGDTLAINCPTTAAWEVRMRRTSASSESTAIRDDVLWQSLKCELPTRSNYPRISTLAIRIPGNVTLASNAQNQVNTVQTRKLPAFDAEDQSALAPTRRIADAFAYLVRSVYPESVLRMDELQQLNTAWEAAGQSFNGVFDTGTTFKEAADRLLAVGFAKHYPAKGQIHILHDRPREAFGQFFSPDNCFSIKETGRSKGYNDYDGIRVEYTDPDTWLPAFINCILPEQAGENLQSVRLYGCTDKTQAYRYGMRKASEMHYLRRKWSISTEQEGLNILLGEKCSLPSRETQSGYCVSYQQRVMTLSHDLDLTADTMYVISIRRPDGVGERYECTKVTNDAVLLSTDLGFTPAFDDAIDPPLFKIGTPSDWITPAIAQSVKPKQKGKVDVELILYDERIFNYDAANPPE